MKFTLYIILIIILTGCYEKCDFTIPKAYKSFLNEYNVGDTLYFISNKGKADTIRIIAYDTMEVCGQGFMTEPRKHFIYRIKHLPKNNWICCTEGHQDGRTTIINQKLIVIEKTFDPNDSSGYYVEINYREFRGVLLNIYSKSKNTKFPSLNIDDYWIIPKSNNYSGKILDTEISTIFWSAEYGLTGYENGTGEVFEIKRSL
jgi:hypothetical protein